MSSDFNECMSRIVPASKKALERLAASYGVVRMRRFLYREGDKRMRARVVRMITRNPGTLADIKASSEDRCVGLKDAAVTESPGRVLARLSHRWWAFPWARGNRRRVRAYLREHSIAAGVELEVR